MDDCSPRVSVVVPAFEAARFLDEAIGSIRTQTHAVDEVVIVDDGSTDETLAIAHRLAATWTAVRVIAQENRGPSAARNAGLSEVEGDLVTFLDADDRMVSDRIAAQVGYLHAHPEIDVVFGQKQDELEPGAVAPVAHADRPAGARPDYVISMMVRREALERVGGFDPERRLSEEYDWLSRATAAGFRFAVIEQVLVRRRLHGANLTQDVPVESPRNDLLRIMRARVDERRGIQ